eukprot:SAG11_NODE_14_length_26344_cov_14.209411_1_plen_33_part_10
MTGHGGGGGGGGGGVVCFGDLCAGARGVRYGNV